MVCLKRLYNVSCASLAQLVEHRSRKAGVTSSSLVAGSMKSQVVALWWLPFLCEWLELFDCLGVAKIMLPRGCCRNSAARNAPSWVVIIALPNLQQVGHDLPYLQQVWFIYTKLVVSMAVQAILGAFLAALGSMIMLVRFSRNR